MQVTFLKKLCTYLFFIPNQTCVHGFRISMCIVKQRSKQVPFVSNRSALDYRLKRNDLQILQILWSAIKLNWLLSLRKLIISFQMAGVARGISSCQYSPSLPPPPSHLKLMTNRISSLQLLRVPQDSLGLLRVPQGSLRFWASQD